MYHYSPSKNAFYPEALKQDYIKANNFPDDTIEVSEEIYLEFAGNLPPNGKVRTASKNAHPHWIDAPVPTKEEQIECTIHEKQQRIREANQITQLWQTQLMLGIINADDKAELTRWMVYVQQVQKVDVLGKEIKWPEKPDYKAHLIT